MRLIDADLPREQMEKLLAHHLMMSNFAADGATSDCIAFLDLAPTIDAVPVVHGRWINPDDAVCYQCSNCKEYANQDYGLTNAIFLKYCPNCGVRMDGDSNDQ